jgi:hypothetical protein
MNFKDAPKNVMTETLSPKAMTNVIKLDSPQKEELLTGKKVREDRSNTAETEEKVAKTLNFPEFDSNNYDYDLYHVVRGKRVCGLWLTLGQPVVWLELRLLER